MQKQIFNIQKYLFNIIKIHQNFYLLLCCLLRENEEIFSFFIKKLLCIFSSLFDKFNNCF